MAIGRGRGRETTNQHCVLLLRKKDGKMVLKKVRGENTGKSTGENTGNKYGGNVREQESKGKSHVTSGHVTSGHFRSSMCNGPIPLIDPPQI